MKGARLNDLVIRADANTRIGCGHLMRCLALAEAWRDRGGHVVLVAANESSRLDQRVRSEGIELVSLRSAYPDPGDWKTTLSVLDAHRDALVVVDGYHFDPTFHGWVKEAEHPVMVIDDNAHLDHYRADVLLNQNIHARHLNYSCEPTTRLLLGTRYVLLRREFRAWEGWKREIPRRASRVLVTMGGGDPHDQTGKVLNALDRIDADLQITVVVGGANRHLPELRSQAAHSVHSVRMVEDAREMSGLMAWADVALTAGGSTCWEIAFMQLPMLVMVTADNQRAVGAGLQASGSAICLGWWEQVSEQEIARSLERVIGDAAQRSSMARLGRQLVDGRGVERVLRVMEESCEQRLDR